MVAVGLPESAIPARGDWREGNIELIDVSGADSTRAEPVLSRLMPCGWPVPAAGGRAQWAP